MYVYIYLIMKFSRHFDTAKLRVKYVLNFFVRSLYIMRISTRFGTKNYASRFDIT